MTGDELTFTKRQTTVARRLVVGTVAVVLSIGAGFPITASASSAGSQPLKPKCTPGYRPCLPPAFDYDCRGGSGDGPRYTGRVVITGYDIYGLDTDNDGIGCD